MVMPAAPVRRVRFGPLEIDHGDDVLVPRAWTLAQARWASSLAPSLPEGPVLELCAGAGQIGLAVAVATGRPLVQVDGDPAACRYALANAGRAGVATDVRCAPLDAGVRRDERFPLIVADPPYVPSDRVHRYPDDPVVAIDGGPDGLDPARRCIEVAARHLLPGGALLLQLGGVGQAAALAGPVRRAWLELAEVRAYGEGRAVALVTAP